MENPLRKESVTVYRPNQRHELGFVGTWLVLIRSFVDSRELIWQLFRRDFFVSYKKSFIGATWIILTPLSGILVWVFLKHSGVLQPGEVGVPYPVYVLIGSSVWGLFMGFYTAAANTLKDGQHLAQQVHYPHEIFLFVRSMLQIVNFFIALVLNLLVLVFFGVIPSAAALFFPLVALPLFLLGAGIGLLVSMLSVVAFDLEKAFTALMTLLIWSVPVIYSGRPGSPLLQTIIRWNPLTYLVCSSRDILLFGRLYDPPAYAISAALALAVFLVSLRLFYVSESELVERMHT
jgi:lipopolysaccharide transport system permease protein